MDRLTHLLKEEWNNMNKTIVYHSTTLANYQRIMREGLRIGMTSNHTKAGEWADQFYGTRPIYVSLNRGKYTGDVILQLDVTGYTLLADLPGLIDLGAILVDDGRLDVSEVSSRPSYIPDELEIGYDLLNPEEGYDKDFIKLSGTAAIVQNIPKERIKILK